MIPALVIVRALTHELATERRKLRDHSWEFMTGFVYGMRRAIEIVRQLHNERKVAS